ncbi:hypothetical protein EVAR_74829_1 [Eumeta japonica]|uniref:Uncharacterized protein n=1 Tax=Eumeta variegata TaxID=151549 RepID=A0A4C1SS71_EUMVA|nr:hypothetical protein EVAR_74829_1 [Eumeta japonica]
MFMDITSSTSRRRRYKGRSSEEQDEIDPTSKKRESGRSMYFRNCYSIRRCFQAFKLERLDERAKRQTGDAAPADSAIRRRAAASVFTMFMLIFSVEATRAVLNRQFVRSANCGINNTMGRM